MDFDTVLFAFLLTLFAGLSTGIGSILAFFTKRTNTRFLSVSLGFSAGVMLYVAFMEILPEGRKAMIATFGENLGSWGSVGAFFGGIFIIAVIDKLIPCEDNPHELHGVEEMQDVENMLHIHCGTEPHHVVHREGARDGDIVGKGSMGSLKRMGFFTAIAIGIHNFPEGMATFTAALAEPQLGIAIAIAVAIHNIPEGIAVSIPVYYATGNRKTAFIQSFLSGLAEPVGAIVGFLLIMPFFSSGIVFGILFSVVSGIMVFISLDELLPASERYGEHHLCIYGLLAGMLLMAVSLLLL